MEPQSGRGFDPPISPVAMYARLRPLLFRLDAERAHDVALAAAQLAQARALPLVRRRLGFVPDPRLAQTLFGLAFDHPVGLAAGLDKAGRLVPFWGALGFAFVEVGSATARPSPGNPRPRLFRLPDDRALVNRMGLNNPGAARVAQAVRVGRRRAPRLVVAVNLAKTHDPALLGAAALDDFRAGYRAVAGVADLVVVNVSCPNTREGKTFEEPRALDGLLAALAREAGRLGATPPLLVKLAPPPEDVVRGAPMPGVYAEIVDVLQRHGVSGIVATNTAPDRAGLAAAPSRVAALGAGGLSGAPLARRADALVAHLYRLTGGQLPIVGVGGIFSVDDAWRRIEAGASLVEVYTGLVYEGPGLVRRLHDGLRDRLGPRALADVIGSAA